MNHTGERVGTVLGRLLLSFIFIMSAFGKLSTGPETDGYIKSEFTRLGISESLVTPARYAAILFELVGGVLVLLGLWARFGALLLMMFLIIVTPIFHHF